MDDNQNKRSDPRSNPFNNADSPSTLGEYDEFGNRIESKPQEDPMPGIAQNLTQNNAEEVHGDPAAHRRISDLIKNEMPITANTEQTREETPPATDEPVSEVIKEDLSIASDHPKENGFVKNDAHKAPGDNFIKKITSAKTIIAVLVIIAAVGVILLAGFMIQSDVLNPTAKINPPSSADDIANKISGIIDLPVNEKPSQVVRIDDPAEFSETNAFKKVARSGDLIFIYEKSQLAVLYRPGSGKVVSMGQINSASENVAGTATESAAGDPDSQLIGSESAETDL